MNKALINYTLFLADNAVILAQRNAEWCGHGPILEQDIAITNITLDLIGQSRSLYQYAATLLNETGTGPHTEDTLAYLRGEREFKNLLLTEQPNGDWGQTVLRQYFFSQYQQLVYGFLESQPDAQLAAIAAKSLKEVAYHVRWSSEWVVRLGDGTEESHQRMEEAIKELWTYTGELFEAADYEKEMNIPLASLKEEWNNKVKAVLEEATLSLPASNFMQTGGKNGKHTEQLGFILAEMQYLQRSHPGAEW